MYLSGWMWCEINNGMNWINVRLMKTKEISYNSLYSVGRSMNAMCAETNILREKVKSEAVKEKKNGILWMVFVALLNFIPY